MTAFQKLRAMLSRQSRSAAESTPEQDAMIAAESLSVGEVTHAALHIGRALMADASRQDWLYLLNRVIAQADDPLTLAPLERSNYSSTIAVRCYILAHRGSVQEALELMGQVLGYSPGSGYLHWVIGWLEQPEMTRQIDLKPLHLFLNSIVSDIETMAADPDIRRGTVDLLLPLIQSAQRCQQPDSELIFAAVGLMRRAGYKSELLPIAEEAHRAHPDYYTVNTMASAHRAVGDSNHAISMYRDALKIEPDDRAARLDIADLYAEEADFAEAFRWYSEVVERFPDDEWAVPSLYATQFTLTQDKVWRKKLISYVKANPLNVRAKMLMGWVRAA